MVSADHPALVWLRRYRWVADEGVLGWQAGYISGFLNGEDADRVTRRYVENVMNARARGVSA